MRFFRRARERCAGRSLSPTRLHVEQLEARETPAVVPGFAESVLASGLTQPTAMAVAPDGRIFVAEKGGTLRIVQNGSLLATPFLTLNVNTASERGLIGVALDPDFALNGFVYVYYTTNDPTPVNRVSRFLSSGNVTFSPEFTLLNNIPSTNGNHNGGALAFGADGKLYIGVGEAGVSSNSQDLTNLSGKVLRINSGGTIPNDNPFFNTPGARQEIYALGLRNPFTMAFQPGTGRLYINDVGGGSFEEVNEGIAGANYGWPTTEGDFNQATFPQFTRPVYAYAHGTGALQGRSIAGGAFYNPTSASFPAAYVGDYFFGDFIAGRIFLRDSETGAVTAFANPTAGGGVVDLDVLPDGRLLYLSLNTGTIYQITATGQSVPPAQLIAVGTGPGTPSQVAALNADGTTRFVVSAFAGYSGGVRVATGDVTGDGVEDVIVVPAPGAPPHVKVFDGVTGGLAQSFYAFSPSFASGLSVAAGDVTGDGRADIIVGTASTTTHVKVFDGVSGAEIRSFLAYDGFTGGVTVAAGDVTGDGRADIITGTATGTSHVKVFDSTASATLNSFLAFAPGYLGGVSVGYANGSAVVGAAAGPPNVKTFANGTEQLSFFAFAPTFLGGVQVAGNGSLILAGAGRGAGPHLKGFAPPTLSESISRFVFDPSITSGIFVG